MERGKKEQKGKLKFTDSSSDIESEPDYKQPNQFEPHRNNQITEQQHNDEEDELDEDEVEMLIKQTEEKMKRNSENKSKEPEAIVPEKIEFASSQTSETVTLNSLKQSKREETQSLNLEHYKLEKIFENMFPNETKDEAVKALINKKMSSQEKKVEFLERNLISEKEKSKQYSVKLGEIPVYFPYEPYEVQNKYMHSVIDALNRSENALLESPTGTGKTLCLLASTLSWVESFKSEKKINIIYCSRTHTQLHQVQKELEKTCFRPTISNFGSRDQFCIKEEFETIKGRDKMESCSKAVKLFVKELKNRKNEDEPYKEEQEDLELDPAKKKEKAHMCCFYKSEAEYINILERFYKSKIVTSEIIKQEGQMRGFCPYYYAFSIKEQADLVFMPYNYILDVDRLNRYENLIRNSIIIFDEAHNVPESACEGRSFEITSRIFENVDNELKKLEYHPSMSPQLRIIAYEYEPLRMKLIKCYHSLKEKLDEMARGVLNKRQLDPNFRVYDETFDTEEIFSAIQMRESISEWFSPILWNTKEFRLMTEEMKRATHAKIVANMKPLVKETNEFIESLKETYDGIFQNMEKLNSFIDKCSELIGEVDNKSNWWESEHNHYRLSIKANIKENVLWYEVRMVCLTPSLTFGDLLKLKPRSIILTSGTLSPLSSWEKELNLNFNVKLVNNHVIDHSQLHLGIINKSIGNSSNFNFSYKELNEKGTRIYCDLIDTILYLAGSIPNGVLVIFPSYKIIKKFKDELTKNSNALKELNDQKFICFEDKGTVDYTILNFKNKAKTKKGAILFCVCRGKVSEGLDFSDELCRAVIFIGVPYPNIMDPILKEKREYYDKLSRSMKNNNSKTLTGSEWYDLNTMRAVNQGIGRVIRHIKDYGMIFLLDSRYEYKSLRDLLPGWSKNSTTVYKDFDLVQEKVNVFYQNMEKIFPRIIKEEVEDEDLSLEDFMNPKAKKKPVNPYQSKINSNPLQFMMDQAKRRSKQDSKKQSFGKKKNQIDFL